MAIIRLQTVSGACYTPISRSKCVQVRVRVHVPLPEVTVQEIQGAQAFH